MSFEATAVDCAVHRGYPSDMSRVLLNSWSSRDTSLTELEEAQVGGRALKEPEKGTVHPGFEGP